MKLAVYVNGTRAGCFIQHDSGAITLDYDREWQHGSGRVAVAVEEPRAS